jgi:hypothetical protein
VQESPRRSDDIVRASRLGAGSLGLILIGVVVSLMPGAAGQAGPAPSYLPAAQSGSPMSYQVGGKQYVVVAVSGRNYSGEYIAFALPDSEVRPSGQHTKQGWARIGSLRPLRNLPRANWADPSQRLTKFSVTWVCPPPGPSYP